MKIVAVLFLTLQALAADSRGRLPFDPATLPVAYTERITDTQLRKLQDANRTSNEQAAAKQRKVTTAATAASAAPAQTFEEASEFLAFRGQCTFVPKGAILYVPPQSRSCIATSLTGNLLLWGDFLPRNTAWLSTFEVSLEEASGAKPINPERLKAAQRNNRILVAAIRGNPTSVAKQPSRSDGHDS